jgi:DNA-binding LytR/AlgR family response regulator
MHSTDFPIQRYNEVVTASDQILYLEASINYTFVHTCHGQPILLARSIAHFNLPTQNFIRISRKHVVNVNYLTNYCFESFTKSVCLVNGTILPISRRKAKQIKAVFGQ